jgi:hypothetical protein
MLNCYLRTSFPFLFSNISPVTFLNSATFPTHSSLNCFPISIWSFKVLTTLKFFGCKRNVIRTEIFKNFFCRFDVVDKLKDSFIYWFWLDSMIRYFVKEIFGLMISSCVEWTCWRSSDLDLQMIEMPLQMDVLIWDLVLFFWPIDGLKSGNKFALSACPGN